MLPQISVHIRYAVFCYFYLPASNSQLATSPSFRPGGVRAARFNNNEHYKNNNDNNAGANFLFPILERRRQKQHDDEKESDFWERKNVPLR